MEAKKRIAYSTDTPYSPPSWPIVSAEDQRTIIDLLSRLFLPVEQYRSSLLPSKGKRHRKRKRKQTKAKEKGQDEPKPLPLSIPVPPLLAHLTVGLNSTLRKLQDQITLPTPPKAHSLRLDGTEPSRETSRSVMSSDGAWQTPATATDTALAAIFLPEKNIADVLLGQLPTLAYLASKSRPLQLSIRLVRLPQAAGTKFAGMLHTSQASIIGIMHDAPGARPLLDLVRENIQPVDPRWLHEALSGNFLPLKVKMTESPIVPKESKQKRGRRKRNFRDATTKISGKEEDSHIANAKRGI